MKRIKLYRTILGTLALGASMLAIGAAPASAAVIFVFEGTSAGTVAGTTNFTYDINFQTGTDLGTGLPADRFVAGGTTYGTLYDVLGLISAVVTPGAPFTVTTQLIGITPIGIAPTDSATVTNITLTYTGATLTADMSFPLVLVVDSSLSAVNVNGQYSGQDIKNAGSASGTPSTNFGFVAVPAATVPEPGTLYALAGGLGLLVVGGIRRRRRS